MSEACINCAAFVGRDEHARQRSEFGKATGVDMCRAHFIPLSVVGETDDVNKLIRLSTLGQCNGPFEAVPAAPQTRLTIAEVNGVSTADGSDKPRSCTGCQWFIRDVDMLGRFGIPLDVCGFYGHPILHSSVAGGRTHLTHPPECTAAERGKPVPIEKVQLTHLYRDVVAPNLAFLSYDLWDALVAPPLEDPASGESGREVTDAERALGIARWRAVSDPAKVGADVLLPVFDPDAFPEEQRAKIPSTNDPEHPELYRDEHGLLYAVAVMWMHLGETPAFNGPPGVGKTEFFRYAAWAMQLPFERFSITASTEIDDLAGKMLLEGNETVYHYGRLPAAWQRPCVLVVDEPNVGPPEVWQFLRPLTDDSKQLVLDMNKGERIDRNPYAFLGMAFNPSWDMRNTGTHEIADADGSRLMHVHVPQASPEVETAILRQACSLDGYEIKDETLKAIVKIGADLRGLAQQDAFPVYWGTRQQKKVARASQWFSLDRCYLLAAGDYLERVYCDKIRATVQSHVK